MIKIIKNIRIITVVFMVFSAFQALAADLPEGIIVDKYKINDWLVEFANFLIGAGLVLGVIMIVYSGIRLMMPGNDAKGPGQARDILKSSILGIAVILGVGLIIKTITSIINDSFFR